MICIDASMVIKLLVAEEDSHHVEALWKKWCTQKERIIAPYFLFYEVLSVLHNKCHRSIIDESELFEAIQIFRRIPLNYLFDYELMDKTLQIARITHQPTIYDACYLMLAIEKKAEYWTADRKFYQKIKNHFQNCYCI